MAGVRICAGCRAALSCAGCGRIAAFPHRSTIARLPSGAVPAALRPPSAHRPPCLPASGAVAMGALARCRHVSRFCGARSAHLTLSDDCPSVQSSHISPSVLLRALHALQRDLRGGDTRRSEPIRRDAPDAADADARRDGRYSDQAPGAAGADGWHALRRTGERGRRAPPRRTSKAQTLTECAGREMPPP